ncbi:hypothetical protein E2C01_052008 [Portunus trituberculatus]|uniref:Uncharacterized protein n=1 Tax=Portunus trituberculatus TaxID=210409 RepID=A0A5B7GKE7_PORTR|nr:hypothetical protein [Portunus trituberculatus]
MVGKHERCHFVGCFSRCSEAVKHLFGAWLAVTCSATAQRMILPKVVNNCDIRRGQPMSLYM